MRRNLSICFMLLLVAFTSCKKEYDDVFDGSPDDRINETLAAYSKALTGAPYGWKALVYPSALPATGFGFYFRFDSTNRVDMFSDFDSLSAVTVRTSSYRLKSLQQPCLLFDTYSYIHVLCDPDASKNGGYYGKGLFSDFEFSIDNVSEDTIKLTGRLNGSKAIFVKATSQEAQDYYDKKRNWEFNKFSRFLTYFKELTVGNNKYDIYADLRYRQLRFTWNSNNGEKTFITNYHFDNNGIVFSNPFRDGAISFSGFNDIKWNANTQRMTMKAGENTALISSSIKPQVLDIAAGRRWYNTAAATRTYWASPLGFHIDGVDDAYGVNRLEGFNFMVYFPVYDGTYDFTGIVPSGFAYGPALTPVFRTNGTVAFEYTQLVFGDIPATASNTVSRIITKYQESEGFYFVQTSPTSYDMVNARDARTWISWQQ
ncbi:DUF4302 domain-containing protein [Chitinophaga rhizophila]|uniref:DUF4302 domain-containing protein n=1 Tax=Chitinophaga rhizophila TaxID=2866212 RepID=A0ABS7G805_9BACT|nr:DUF4302 domain-containing protein [Chitinophaga rhizophila]MBW8683793.1 DUF4302 domain-containing protein [Chitinophaga rhizophila]